MSKFAEMYKSKVMPAEEALKQIPDKALIATGFSALEPRTCLEKLHTIYDRVNEVTLYGGGGGDYEYVKEPYVNKFFVTTNFYGGLTRKLHPTGRASLIPMHLHACYTRYYDVNKPNVIITSGTPMDKHGYFNLSLGGWEKAFLPTADVVIVEVVKDMPKVAGEYEIHISQVTAVVETDRSTPGFDPGVLTDVDKAIGANVAGIVKDGSTIQLGIGAVPDAVAMAFMGKKNLGVHTEMVTSSIAALAEAGVIDGTKKSLHPGKIIGSFANGSRALYDFMDENPSIYMIPTFYVNDPCVVAKNDNMVSINTCIEVDLVGQISSESIGPRQFSGTGGQNDFAEGAIHSKNGMSIIAMASAGTKKDGTNFSKIKSMLTPGAIVTMSRNNIDYIVTEYGVAPMKARTVKDRVNNLIAIAHPDFRAQLREEANKLMLW
jgi:acyl-CoA hydrolase